MGMNITNLKEILCVTTPSTVEPPKIEPWQFPVFPLAFDVSHGKRVHCMSFENLCQETAGDKYPNRSAPTIVKETNL